MLSRNSPSAVRWSWFVLSTRAIPAAWGFSIAVYPAEDGSLVVPSELSLTKRPSFEDARVLGTGDEALEFWSIATGQHHGVTI
jgi:hypothetical protein